MASQVDVDLLRRLVDHAEEDGGHVGVVLTGVEEVVHQFVVSRDPPAPRVPLLHPVLDKGVAVPGEMLVCIRVSKVCWACMDNRFDFW